MSYPDPRARPEYLPGAPYGPPGMFLPTQSLPPHPQPPAAHAPQPYPYHNYYPSVAGYPVVQHPPPSFSYGNISVGPPGGPSPAPLGYYDPARHAYSYPPPPPPPKFSTAHPLPKHYWGAHTTTYPSHGGNLPFHPHSAIHVPPAAASFVAAAPINAKPCKESEKS